METNKQKWLWEPYIPTGSTTLLIGHGTGRDILTARIIAATTNGTPAYEGYEALPFGKVMVISAGEKYAESIQPMIRAAGVRRGGVYSYQSADRDKTHAYDDPAIDIAVNNIRPMLLVMDERAMGIPNVDPGAVAAAMDAIANKYNCAVLIGGVDHRNRKLYGAVSSVIRADYRGGFSHDKAKQQQGQTIIAP